MKKYLLAIGLVAFLMTSCCDKQENKENCEQKECCKDKKEQCDKHHECNHQQAPCPEMMAQIDIMVKALANWEDLDEEQRAEAIDMAKKMEEMKANMPKPECCKEGKPECCKHEGKCEGKHEGCKHECKHEEGKKCEGNHEGCQHQHEGCEHHQDK